MEDTKLNLQLFADGGDAADAGEGSGDGANAVDDAAEAAAKHAEEWNNLIKGDFREDYQRSVKDHVDRRFKHQAELEERLGSQDKLISFLSERYGQEDPAEILNSIMNDDALFQEEAAERGLSTDQYKEMKRLQFEKAQSDRELEQLERQRAADETYAKWIKEAEQVKTLYPGFELETELANERFVDLITKNVDLMTAYQVIHMNDTITGAMQTTAQAVAQKVTDGIRSKGMRPLENGIASPTQPVNDKVDFSKMSVEDMKQYARRAGNGERITFS